MTPEQRDRMMQVEFNLEVLEEELAAAGEPTANLLAALRYIDRLMRAKS
jgi:hypothetical protein